MWVAGPGELLRLVRAHYPFRSFGCDYTDKLLSVPGIEIHTVDLNREPLPYSDNRFALVTCIETVEHLENYREVVREIYRVLQPGGVAVFSTPNILNLRSRLRYLSSGFYNLFGPLAPDESAIHTTRGHINPVSTLDERNAWVVRAMNSPQLLLGRTLIVTAVKPG